MRAILQTQVEGRNRFLQTLDPKFVASDLVDERFVHKPITAAGYPAAFGLTPTFKPPTFKRSETIAA